MASEAAFILFSRVFLDVPDVHLSAMGSVEHPDDFSRTQNYLMIPKAQGLCPLTPQGSAIPTLLLNVKAQLPSSVVMSFDLDLGRMIILEAHVHPETYGTSRLTLVAYRNFAKWPGASLMVRYSHPCFMTNSALTLAHARHCYFSQPSGKNLQGSADGFFRSRSRHS